MKEDIPEQYLALADKDPREWPDHLSEECVKRLVAACVYFGALQAVRERFNINPESKSQHSKAKAKIRKESTVIAEAFENLSRTRIWAHYETGTSNFERSLKDIYTDGRDTINYCRYDIRPGPEPAPKSKRQIAKASKKKKRNMAKSKKKYAKSA